jgi:hypothetical protein
MRLGEADATVSDEILRDAVATCSITPPHTRRIDVSITGGPGTVKTSGSRHEVEP